MLRQEVRSPAEAAPSDSPAARAIYHTPQNGFMTFLPAVPAHVFSAERDRAFDPATGTAFVTLDLSGPLATAYPATTPTLLARYARLRAGGVLRLAARCSGEAYHVLQGSGRALKAGDRIDWRAGDTFCLPGGVAETVLSAAEEAVLFLVTDEPAFGWSGASPALEGLPAMQAVHYPAAVAEAEMAQVQARVNTEKLTGKVVIFTSPGLEKAKTVTPTISLALNALEPGGDQPPHRHNSVALTLCLEGRGVYSLIDGQRVDWQRHAVMVTPPLAAHSHHNRGPDGMLSLVAQDAGIYYNARAIGFSFA
ncbi:MAG: cupin domain-containing protein [Alphaproteobacteria bacterium]|nr:cupin domain-containing protein [Alphaproteobacteria bacterium]